MFVAFPLDDPGGDFAILMVDMIQKRRTARFLRIGLFLYLRPTTLYPGSSSNYSPGSVTSRQIQRT
jgi:hypothetical protein